MYCIKCGKKIPDIADYCNFCGQAQNIRDFQTQKQNVNQYNNLNQQNQANNFNSSQDNSNSHYYNNQSNSYGTPQGNSNQQYYQASAFMQTITPMQLIKNLSSKVKMEGVIWTVIASLQVIAGLCFIIAGIILMNDNEDGTSNLISGGIVLFVAIINFSIAIGDLTYSKSVLVKPIGIVEKYKPVSGLVGTLIYNLVVGGVIGVVGIVFGFATRSYVMNNSEAFIKIEKEFKMANNKE